MKNKKWLWIVLILVVIACLVLSCLGLGAATFFIIREADTSSFSEVIENIEIEPTFPQDDTIQPTPFFGDQATPAPTESFEPVPDPVRLESAEETLQTLKDTFIPNNDPRELAIRLSGLESIAETVPDTTDYNVGDTKEFWVTNVDTNQNFRITAQLAYETPHVYFWIEEGVSYRERDLSRLVETFESKIYPTNREFFGSEWSPGIDENEHLFLMYATNLGGNLAGYFSSADSVPPEAHPYSNAHEMFMLNADNIALDERFTYGVLAHEFQHMIHWYRDRNETSWLNEGFSELAAFLNGYYESGFDYLAMMEPDMQLNDWPNDPGATTPHYGAAFLFVTYFLDRFGEEATQAVVSNPTNGMDSIDEVLQEINAQDPLSSEPITANDVFADWVVTNYLHDPNANDGRFTYTLYEDAPQTYVTETVSACDLGWQERTVKQYGADYIELGCSEEFVLTFQGATEVGVLPQDPYSGDYAVWSNKGDESDMTLTRSFDFSGVEGPIEFSFRTWYDLETDYDYLYLEVSENGEDWTILDTPSCTTENPSGNSYGCGYNDTTGGWIEEVVDLSEYAGKEIQLRFEYITDAAVNGEGFLLDDVSIPAIDYFSDFEEDLGGWEPAGWVRIQNVLPQTFVLSLIQTDGTTEVTRLTLAPDQTIQLRIDGSQYDETILTVSGTTRFTRQLAGYRFHIQPAD